MSFFSQFEFDLRDRSYLSRADQLVMRLQELRDKEICASSVSGSGTLNESDLKYAPTECISSLPDIRRAAEMCEYELYSTWHIIYFNGTVWALPLPEGFADKFETLSGLIHTSPALFPAPVSAAGHLCYGSRC